jgi:hypothetical protein
MDPILVPAPPRSAYNPNRRVSDLLLSQVKHFQHVELRRRDLGIDPEIARNIYTEGGAALYIAAVTRALRSAGRISQPTKLSVVSSAKPTTRRPKAVPTEGLALAASAAPDSTPTTQATPPKMNGKPRTGKRTKASAKKKS